MGITDQPFSQQAEFLVNYDQTDIASGTGIEDFYCGNAGSWALIGTTISNVAFYSNNISTFQVVSPTASYTNLITSSYAMTMNTPRTINGDVIITTTAGWNENGGAGANDCGTYLTSELLIVDEDGNETSLGTDESDRKETSGASGFKTRTMKINVLKQKVKFGEKLKLIIRLFGKKTAGSDTILMGWGQDPMARTDDYTYNGSLEGVPSSYTTKLLMQVPFKIETV